LRWIPRGGAAQKFPAARNNVASFLHSGDFGDAIYALPSVRALGGGEIYFVNRPWTRSRWDARLLATIAPLIEATGYATVALHKGEAIDHDFSTFRNGGHKLGETIVKRQSRWVGAEISLEPWLRADPQPIAPLIINRGSRWQGWHFPWAELVGEFSREEMVFIGLPSEHQAFQKEFGRVAFHLTKDLLEAAQVIAGAELFIGNQSAALAIANGLGKPIAVEVCAFAPDCFYPRANAHYSFNGELSFAAGGRKFESLGFQGRFTTEVNGRKLSSDDPDKLRVIARSLHAYEGSFAFFEEVEVN
jgi:hypothetical protein